MDRQRFQEARDWVLNDPNRRSGIGSLGEKSLHAVIKHYLEPSESRHEVKVGGFFADAAGENGIFEIQTRQFNKLRKKLPAFLALTNVTVVYPVPRTKWILWVDEETGEVTERRKSPRTGQPGDILYELCRIKDLLPEERLQFRILLLEVEEYRSLNGWSADKKRGSTRYERVPVALLGEVAIRSAADYEKLLPAGLPAPFTSADFRRAARMSPRVASGALSVLRSMGTIVQVGKQGKQYLYEARHAGSEAPPPTL